MAKRYVDANVLDDLARDHARTEGDLQSLLNSSEWRVNTAPRRGWDQGTWWDVRNTVKSELTHLDDHGRELVNRANRVWEVARERKLRELRELWAAIAGLRDKIDSTAGWLTRFWEDHKPSFRKSVLPAAMLTALGAALPPLAAVFGAGAVIIGLSPLWVEALRRLQSTPEAQAPPVSQELKKQPALTITAKIVAKEATPLQIKTPQFIRKHPEGSQINEPPFIGQCVALVKAYAKEVLRAPLDTFPSNSPNEEWRSRQAFDVEKEYDQIPWGRLQGGDGLEVGDIIFFDWTGYGHVGIVTKVYGNGRFQVMDQNYMNNQTVKLREISPAKPPGEYKFHGVMRLQPERAMNL